jgi:hypothetical protein
VPVNRRTSKRRKQLGEDAERWLSGEPSGFFEFKDADELAALWAEYGDPKVAVWDEGARKPRARKTRPVGSDSRSVWAAVQNDSAGLRTTGDFFAIVG